MSTTTPELRAGRYAIYREIARGGMASVHLGRQCGAAGFSRVVAVKRMHPQVLADPEMSTRFTDEARLAARIRHPNVVPTLDVVAEAGELILVMEYVHGETLARLIGQARHADARMPPAVAAAILWGALQGLHAAHEAVGKDGQPLCLVHRDVTPQNIVVGVDGTARMLDFGIAKAVGRMQTTKDGAIMGKLGYMPPEQLYGEKLDRRVDIYAAGVVLWESLVGARLFAGEDDGPAVLKALTIPVVPPSKRVDTVPPEIDAVVMRALDLYPEKRYQTALEMADALERAIRLASPAEVGAWVRAYAGPRLEERAQEIALLEQLPETDELPPVSTPMPASTTRVSWTSQVAPPTSTPLPTASATAQTAAFPRPRPPVPSAPQLASMDPGATHIASVTPLDEHAGSQPPSLTTSRPLAVLVGLAGAAALVIAIALSVMVQRGGDAGVAEATTIAPVAIPIRAPAATPVSAPGAPAQAATAPGATGATATEVTAPRAESSASAAPAPPKAPGARPADRPARKAVDCDPPFTIDAQGHKKYKRECLR